MAPLMHRAAILARSLRRPALSRALFRPAARRAFSAARGAEESADARLAALGYELPPVPEPKGSYELTSRLGNALHLAGHIPARSDGSLIVGKVGVDLSDDEARAAAEVVGLNILATLRSEVGLGNVVKIHKLVGFVNCCDGFANQPFVINGCSDLLHAVLGPDVGVHARSAVGTNALPLNIPVEIEAIVEVHPGS